jgi:PLP dependent protein
MIDSMTEQIAAIRARIEQAAARSGRDPEQIRLIGVTKTHPVELVARALAAGIHDVGENRVQEAEQKIALLAAERPQLRWHLIGHLQSNKARKAARLFDWVHSVDSLRLAQALSRAHEDGAIPQPTQVLLQVNVSGEASKEGFDLASWEERPDALAAFIADAGTIAALPGLQVRGLMTIAPIGSPDEARPHFRRTRMLRDLLCERIAQADWSQLSMGMTDDFEVAIEEGSSMVRIGRAIFGAR